VGGLLTPASGARGERPPAQLSLRAEQAIRAHSWPGNLAELDSRLRQAQCLCTNGMITDADLGLGDPGSLDSKETLAEAVEEFKKQHITKILERCGGNRTQAARVLGVDARTMFRYLERMKG